MPQFWQRLSGEGGTATRGEGMVEILFFGGCMCNVAEDEGWAEQLGWRIIGCC